MNLIIKRLISILLFNLISGVVFAMTDEIEFSPVSGVVAKIVIDGNNVTTFLNGVVDKNVNGVIFNTGKKLSIKIEDFNFDGAKEFSIHHIDDGMGTYYLDRIFLYSKTTKGFSELLPNCGDEFINLKVNKKLEKIIYTRFVDNKPSLCSIKFNNR